MSTVSIQTNTASLMNALSVTFTDKTKVLTEVIQNSRRASATSVSIEYAVAKDTSNVESITICDDGSGIQNMQDIFTVGGSNWNDKTNQEENPYGIGSIAMLYACESLQIISNHDYIKVDCQQIINGESFSVETNDVGVNGTVIILTNTVFDEKRLVDFLNGYAKYSSVPIKLNGELLASEMSLIALRQDENYTCLETPLGTVAFRGGCSLSIQVILQDLNVYRQYSYHATFFANHKLKARMPDRDKLIDEKEAIEQIKDHLTIAYKEHLTSEKLGMDSNIVALEKWVTENLNSIVEFAPALLNDIGFLPKNAFSTVDYPCMRDTHYYCETKPVRDGEVDAITFTSIQTDRPILLVALYKLNAQTLSVKLDSEHWLFKQAEAFNEDKATLNVENPRESQAPIDIGGSSLTLSVADGLSVTYGSWTQPIKHGAFLVCEDDIIDWGVEDDDEETKNDMDEAVTNFGHCILVDIDDIESVLLQYASFRDENENNDDLWLQETVDEVTSAATIAFGVTASDFITRVLPKLPAEIIEQLKASPVTITVNEQGVITANAA